MKIAMIGCPFKTSYGNYTELLKSVIESRTGAPIHWLASNCGCGDPVETNKLYQIQDCTYFELPHILNFAYTPARKRWKHWLRSRASHLSYARRSRRYAELSADAELVHFQQILNAYGFSVVYHWLNLPSDAARVVTVHELDPYQLEFPAKCAVYNKANAIHVHCEEMKEELVKRGVHAEKIHVIPQGAVLPSTTEDRQRNGIIFYGGHHLMSGKGLQTLFKAQSILKERMGSAAPVLKMHGHYSAESPAEADSLVQQFGVADKVEWLPPLNLEEMAEVYCASRVCVLPYTRGFAGLAASIAAANGLPVVATRRAGIPDHLGDCGIFIECGNAAELAARVLELLENQAHWQTVSQRLRRHAGQYLSMNVIADRTLDIYQEALRN